MLKPNIVTLTECAQIFGYSRRSIENWIVKEGAPVVSRPGKGKATQIDTVALSNWLMDRGSGSTPIEKARLGKLREEITQLQLERIDRQSRLCPVGDVKELFANTLEMLERDLEPLPRLLSKGNTRLRVKWEREIRTVLELASDKLKAPGDSKH